MMAKGLLNLVAAVAMMTGSSAQAATNGAPSAGTSPSQTANSRAVKDAAAKTARTYPSNAPLMAALKGYEAKKDDLALRILTKRIARNTPTYVDWFAVRLLMQRRPSIGYTL